jgi:hypothetical protein
MLSVVGKIRNPCYKLCVADMILSWRNPSLGATRGFSRG